MLKQFTDLVVQAHLSGVSLADLRLSLTHNGMSEDEISDLLDLVVVEVRHARSHHRNYPGVQHTSVSFGQCANSRPLSD